MHVCIKLNIFVRERKVKNIVANQTNLWFTIQVDLRKKKNNKTSSMYSICIFMCILEPEICFVFVSVSIYYIIIICDLYIRRFRIRKLNLNFKRVRIQIGTLILNIRTLLFAFCYRFIYLLYNMIIMVRKQTQFGIKAIKMKNTEHYSILTPLWHVN